jgi:hypothetical protein
MAKTPFRKLAKNFDRQAKALAKLGKLQDDAAALLPQSATASAAELQAAIAADDMAQRSFFQSDAASDQADAYNVLADGAGEPA